MKLILADYELDQFEKKQGRQGKHLKAKDPVISRFIELWKKLSTPPVD